MFAPPHSSSVVSGTEIPKISPKSKLWGRISGGRPRGYPGGRPGAKASVKPSKSWKNKHFGADVHDPKARTSMTPGGFKKTSVRKTSGWIFVPYCGCFISNNFPTLVRGDHPNFWWCAGDHPSFRKKTLWECMGKWNIFMWVPSNSGNRSRSCSENCGFRIAQILRRHSENGISRSENYFPNSESCSENTPERSQSSKNWPFHSESVFSWNWGGPQASDQPPLLSRLSFPATEPLDPRVFEGFLKGSLKGSLKGFEGVLRRTLQNPFKTPSRTLREPSKKVSKSIMRQASRGLKISCRVRVSCSRKWKSWRYFSKKYHNTPPICIAVRLQFVLQCFLSPYALRKRKYCLRLP